MGDAAENGKAYGEREIGAILRRAAELQATHDGAAAAARTGATLVDLEQAAADVGIEARFVRAAAVEHEGRTPDSVPASLVELRREIQGEVTDETWDEIVAELRRTFGDPGTISRSGCSYEWHWSGDLCIAHVTVRPRNGHSEIEILSPVRNVVAMSWIMTGIGGLFALLVSLVPLAKHGHAPAPVLLAIAAAIIAATFLGTPWLAGWLNRDRRKLRRLLDRVASQAEQAMETSSAPPSVKAGETEAQPLRASH